MMKLFTIDAVILIVLGAVLAVAIMAMLGVLG